MTNEMIETIEHLLKKAKLEEKNEGGFSTDWTHGLNSGYVAALEDLLIYLNGENKNEMHNPHFYFNLKWNVMDYNLTSITAIDVGT